MRTQPRSMRDFLWSLSGPVIWAAHFFAVYLAEALLCRPEASQIVDVRLANIGLTVVAIAVLLFARKQYPGREPPLYFPWVRPLIDLSIVAVLWTAIPIFLIEACKSP